MYKHMTNFVDLVLAIKELSTAGFPAHVEEAIREELESLLPIHVKNRKRGGKCHEFLISDADMRADIVRELNKTYECADACWEAYLLCEEDDEFCWVVESFDTSGEKGFDYRKDCCGHIISRWYKSNPFVSEWFTDDSDVGFVCEDDEDAEAMSDRARTISDLMVHKRPMSHPWNF